jgi:hypothetical protein
MTGHQSQEYSSFGTKPLIHSTNDWKNATNKRGAELTLQ